MRVWVCGRLAKCGCGCGCGCGCVVADDVVCERREGLDLGFRVSGLGLRHAQERERGRDERRLLSLNNGMFTACDLLHVTYNGMSTA